ncbi:hypothetical protein CERSUDRAFT_96030 [Gelatoporia subvermispora B]|uniref:FHA domain-containing protein n=1 Tax=Ceriporiopsis subvermispora (strain B) TaxID=914234 RepID=M2QUQ3_CERS8|nr:hypothetical protein CERSUDRAFT_96030 [Gelatoporia subvermispora B]
MQTRYASKYRVLFVPPDASSHPPGMWVLTGPFDGTTEDTNFQKSKLLRTGTSYTVGRKGQPLIIKHPKISRAHATFIVGEYTEENVVNPTFVPTLSFHNAGNRPRNIVRDGQTIVINNESTKQLQDGDVVHVVTGTPVTVKWERICCYASSGRGQSTSLQACASLGISLVGDPQPEVTHHLTPTFTLTPALATALLSLAHIVKPDWLAEVLRLGTPESDSDKPSSLEEHFVLPPLTKFRPAFSPSLPPALKTFAAWEPDEARASLFNAYRFIFLGERGREVQSALRELVRRGGAEYECFGANSGRRALHQVLAKRQGKERTLVLVAEERSVVAAVGEDEWKELVEEAGSFDLGFISSEKILESVVYADVSHLKHSGTPPQPASNDQDSSPLPDIVYNTHPEEPSIPPEMPTPPAPEAAENAPAPARRRPPPRRAVSRASSREPPLPPPATPALASVEASVPDTQTRPRRNLVRRAGKSTFTLPGIDEPFLGLEDNPSTTDAKKGSTGAGSALPESSAPPSSTPAASKPRSNRLKRRAGTGAGNDLALLGLADSPPGTSYSYTPAPEPAHKRFKALFEESDPDRVAAASMDEYLALGSQQPQTGTSVTQSEGAETQRRGGRGLEVVREEEEESTPRTAEGGAGGTESQGVKRKSQAVEEDVVMEDEDASQGRAKRRAVEGVNAVESSAPRPALPAASKPTSKPTSKAPLPSQIPGQRSKPTSAAGAAPGAPDKDEAFLLAVASTKRGRRAEDDFDREFNNLRISKPDIEQEREAWAVLDDFDDDVGLRGNFMVIVEMDVPEHRTRGEVRRGGGRVEWEGRPDFKKFRRKVLGERRQIVQLHAEGGEDLASQRPYAKPTQKSTQFSSQTLSQTPSHFKESHAKPSQQRKGRSGGRGLFADNSDDELLAPPKPARALATQPEPEPARKPRPRRTAQTQPLLEVRKKSMPLFLSDDEDFNESQATAGRSPSDEEFDMDVGLAGEEGVCAGAVVEGGIGKSGACGALGTDY